MFADSESLEWLELNAAKKNGLRQTGTLTPKQQRRDVRGTPLEGGPATWHHTMDDRGFEVAAYETLIGPFR